MSDRFAEFIRTAKLTTYAAQGDAASVPPLLSGTKQLEFADGEFLYRDIYTGMQYFVGQEIVYRYAHPIWSMAYHGGLITEPSHSSAAAIYAFLRSALRQCPPDIPLRGPASFSLDDFTYTCEVHGTISRFTGLELITMQGSGVYELHFGGGTLAATA